MKKILLKKTNNITEALHDLGLSFPESVKVQDYIDIVDRIKEEMKTVASHLHNVELGKVSYLSKVRVSSIHLQKLFFLFRTYSCLLFPPRGKKSLVKGRKKEKNS